VDFGRLEKFLMDIIDECFPKREAVYIYGSNVVGLSRDDSDIDVCVVLPKGSKMYRIKDEFSFEGKPIDIIAVPPRMIVRYDFFLGLERPVRILEGYAFLRKYILAAKLPLVYDAIRYAIEFWGCDMVKMHVCYPLYLYLVRESARRPWRAWHNYRFIREVDPFLIKQTYLPVFYFLEKKGVAKKVSTDWWEVSRVEIKGESIHFNIPQLLLRVKRILNKPLSSFLQFAVQEFPDFIRGILFVRLMDPNYITKLYTFPVTSLRT